MKSGCCSSVTPCSHQKQWPQSICQTCQIAELYKIVTDLKARFDKLDNCYAMESDRYVR